MDSTNLWYAAVVHRRHGVDRQHSFHGSMDTNGNCVFRFARIPIFPPPNAPISQGFNFFIRKADDHSNTPLWLECARRRVYWTATGFRWHIHTSVRSPTLNIRSDIWPQFIEIGSIDKKDTMEYRFQFQLPPETLTRVITLSVGGVGPRSIDVESAKGLFRLTHLTDLLFESLKRQIDCLSHHDALYRLTTALMHIRLSGEHHGNQAFLIDLQRAQQVIENVQRVAWSYSEFGSHDPLAVANIIVRRPRPHGHPFTDAELTALSLAQHAYLYVSINERGEVDEMGKPEWCEHYAIHLVHDEVRFLCRNFKVHTFSITLSSSFAERLGTVFFAHPPRDMRQTADIDPVTDRGIERGKD